MPFNTSKNTFRIRLIGHQSDIKHCRIEKPVAKHFSQLDHFMDDLKVMVRKKMHREDMNIEHGSKAAGSRQSNH